MRRSVLRWPSPLVACVALGLPLTGGCAIDEGTAIAEDFQEDWTGAPDVADIRTTKNNTLPFSGTASGTLVLEDGTPADRVSARAVQLGRYVARHGSLTGRITADGVTITVDADQGRTREVVALWRSLTADERVVSGEVSSSTWKGTFRWKAEVAVVDAPGALTLFDDMVSEGDRHRPLSDVTGVQVDTERWVSPGLSVRTDDDGNLPTEAIAAYEAVAARHSVSYANLQSDLAGIRVADRADQADALKLARNAAPGLGDAMTVASDPGA